jgi:hypothetical protein
VALRRLWIGLSALLLSAHSSWGFAPCWYKARLWRFPLKADGDGNSRLPWLSFHPLHFAQLFGAPGPLR